MNIFAILCAISIARGDFVTFGGDGYVGEDSGVPSQLLANQFSLGDQTAANLTLPGNPQGSILYTAVDPYRGWVIYVGQAPGNFPLIFRGSVASSEIVSITPPAGISGELLGAAIDSDGNAVLVGTDATSNLPLILRLPLGASTAVQVPISGDGLDGGSLNCVAMTPGNVAILGGQGTTIPLIYTLAPEAAGPEAISLPDPSLNGAAVVIAIGPNGTAILGGNDYTNNQALIYRLAPNSSAADAITIPDPADDGNLYCVAIGPDNTAILGGFTNTGLLIYRIAPGSDSASLISNPTDDSGSINGVAIGSDGTAILGGEDVSTGAPIVYRLAPNASTPVLIPIPDGIQAIISAVGIGAQDIAVLAGFYTDTGGILIFTLPLLGSNLSFVSSPVKLGSGGIPNIAIYPCDGFYDIRRMRPYYYWQQSETINILN
jgi:hypothetical protein